MLSQEILKETPIHKIHIAQNAKMVGFGGWDMPLQYEGILAEYESTRQKVTVFDTSHMGEFFLKGDPKKTGFDRIVTCRLFDMPLKSCRYGTMLNDQGGILDDLIVYRIREEEWMVVVNASTTDPDAAHFQKNLSKDSFFQNRSAQTGKLDIQGPLSREILKTIVPGIEKLEYYTFDYFQVLGENVIVSRTGYTGELGYEIYFPWDKLPKLWKVIFDNKIVKPAGLGVRDVLRVEMCYSLYGHELDETITPLEANLSKFVDLEKDFIGRDALLEQKRKGVPRKMAYFSCDNRRSPRSHYKILSSSGEDVGIVTSGTFSPSLGTGIGMGFVSPHAGKTGDKISISDGKSKIPAQFISRPFYKKGSLKN